MSPIPYPSRPVTKSNGQLDDGTTTDRASPVLFGGPFNSQITTGAAHICAIETVPVVGSPSLMLGQP
jgi:hypothetical protein